MDARIGTLIREGKTVYYATLDGHHAESEILADVELHLQVADRHAAKARQITVTDEDRAIVRAVAPMIKAMAAKAWAMHPNNPANKAQTAA